MNDTDVTGGDLHDLWRVANLLFPEAADAYFDVSKELHKVSGSRDEETLGKAGPWWSVLAQELEHALYYSAKSLTTASGVLNRAVNEFAYVDGASANSISEATEGLTDAGKDLKHDIDDTKPFTDENPYPDYDGPDAVDQPWDWQDVRDTKELNEIVGKAIGDLFGK